MVIEVYPSNIPADIEYYYDIPLCLDKDLVDLRRHVYDNFMIQLSHERDFWDNLILNTKPNPTFTDRERVKEALKLGIEEFGYNLLPRQEKAALNSITAEDYYLIQGPPELGNHLSSL